MYLLDVVLSVFIVVALQGFTDAGYYKTGTVYVNPSTGQASFRADVIDRVRGTAFGYYNNTINDTGLAVLEIQTRLHGSISNEQLVYAAGYLEGVLTASEIWMHFVNMRSFMVTGFMHLDPPKSAAWLAEQDKWMRGMIANHPSEEDAFWRHVAYTISQLDGLHAGYASAAAPGWETDVYVTRLLNSIGDHIELSHVLSPSQGGVSIHQSPDQLEEEVVENGHCSAMVKVSPGFENIFMFHNAWFSFASMLRIFKHYHLNVRDSATAAPSSSFSSYPGLINSMDDYYQLSSQMVMLQTTNNLLNPALFSLIKPQSLLAWQRVRVANMMANSGQEWFQEVRRYNSGTYNNQYMIVDLKKVTLGRQLADGTLWVIEQMPGLVVGADQTTILRAGYWPSYNVPFYPAIYNGTGYGAYYALTNNGAFSYQTGARAILFRRDQSNVVDVPSLQAFSRYNDFRNDPYANGNPDHAICSRNDHSAFGCTDAKVCDFFMAQNMTTLMINGPTTSHNLPVFSWNNLPNTTVSHVGLPTEYNFDWLLTKPRL